MPINPDAVGTTSAILNLILVVILYLMIWKPGL